MTVTTSVSPVADECPYSPQASSPCTNYLVRVQHEDGQLGDYIVYGVTGMTRAELRSAVYSRYSKYYRVFLIVNAVSL